MKIVKLFVGVSIGSVSSEIEKVQAESDTLQKKEDELFSLPLNETDRFQQHFLLTESQRSKLCSKADYLVSTTLNLDLYRKFRMLGLKVAHPLRTVFIRFMLMSAILLSVMFGYLAITKTIQSTNWYASRQAEKSQSQKDKFILETTTSYYAALEKKSNAEMCIKMGSYKSLNYVQVANESIAKYNTMVSCLPAEKRGELKVMEYIVAK